MRPADLNVSFTKLPILGISDQFRTRLASSVAKSTWTTHLNRRQGDDRIHRTVLDGQ